VENNSWSEVLNGTPQEEGSLFSWKGNTVGTSVMHFQCPGMISQSVWLSSILRLGLVNFYTNEAVSSRSILMKDSAMNNLSIE
jgi:hypothetical protein